MQIPDVQVCVEIPFVDGAEGACTTTVTHESELYSAKEWAAMRPTLISVPAKSWSEIRKSWLQACHTPGLDTQNCEWAPNSIGQSIEELDGIAKTVMTGGLHP